MNRSIEDVRRFVRLIRQAPDVDSATALLVEAIDRTWPMHKSPRIEDVGAQPREHPHPGDQTR